MTAKKSATVILGLPQEKKHVVRYDALVTDEIMASAYLNKAQLAELGNPDKVKITVEAAN